MDLDTKITILRLYETFCYQVCYYIIQDSHLSIEAARETLLAVARDPGFFIATHEEQEKKVRLFAVRSTIRIKTKVGA